MGIIAGIAVPVTIAVINRQKQSAAIKSAEAVVATMKQLTQELLAQASTKIVISLDYAATNGNTPGTATVTIDSGAADSSTYAGADFIVENLKAKGKITTTYTTSDAKYVISVDDFIVSDYDITVADDKVTLKAAKHKDA